MYIFVLKILDYNFIGVAVTQTNMTALHLGVSGGHVEVVRVLAARATPEIINQSDDVSLNIIC